VTGTRFGLLLFALAFIPMLAEARVAARNDRTLRSLGAREPHDDVFAVMQIAYPACFLAMIAEGWLRGAHAGPVAIAGASVFAAAKILKYWAIATLGSRWTFRVLVPPRSSRILSGPYRYLRHPNYVGVWGELAGMALLAQAPVAGVLALAGFGWLMRLRVRVEERALG
jgi:methyltransferase